MRSTEGALLTVEWCIHFCLLTKKGVDAYAIGFPRRRLLLFFQTSHPLYEQEKHNVLLFPKFSDNNVQDASTYKEPSFFSRDKPGSDPPSTQYFKSRS